MLRDDLTNSFKLLAATVRDFNLRNRPCLGATLKPALYNREGFREEIFGFRKFGDFLKAAQAAGFIELRPTPGGDISVWLATPEQLSLDIPAVAPASELPPQPSSPSMASAQRVRVRQDLWNAFNSFSARWVYDPVGDVAFKNDARGLWTQQDPQRSTVAIPSARDRVIEWMRSFASVQVPETGRQLLTVLDGDAAPFQFTKLVRSRGLSPSWSNFHIKQVVAAIESWASANGVRPKNIIGPTYMATQSLVAAFERSPNPPLSIPASPVAPPSGPLTPGALESSRPADSLLTNRLEGLIDKLIDDLIQLRGLLQIAGSKRA